MGFDSVKVYILHSLDSAYNFSKLRKVFSKSLFDLEFARNKTIINCLQDSHKNYYNNYTIVLTDRVICNRSARFVRDTIQNFIKKDNYDLAYLFKYDDKCQMHTPVDTCESSFIVNSYSPRGLDAILYTPDGRDKILGLKPMKNKKKFKPKNLEENLNKEIFEGNLKALAISPNLFDYNTEESADYCKRNECAPLQPFPREIVSNTRVL